MWLPKNERKLLVIYYIAIREALQKIDSKPTDDKWYSTSDVIKLFSHRDYKKEAKTLKDDADLIKATRGCPR